MQNEGAGVPTIFDNRRGSSTCELLTRNHKMLGRIGVKIGVGSSAEAMTKGRKAKDMASEPHAKRSLSAEVYANMG